MPCSLYKKIFTSLLIILCAQLPVLVQAQVLFETLSSTKSEGTINIYGRGNLSQKVPYENIKGSPFWADEWKSATLYGFRANEKWEQPIKLNLATHEIYFKNKNGEELVINDGLVQKIIFHDTNDPAKVEAAFLYGLQPPFEGTTKTDDFLQVLNYGNYQLLKQASRRVTEGDSLFGTLKKYFFTNETNYFISNKFMVRPLKKLNKDNCLQMIPAGKSSEEWITKNKIDLRKEADVVAFLNFVNKGK